MELWDVLDKDRKKTGEFIERGQTLKSNQYHLVVFAIIRNDDGRFLITKRSKEKTFPGYWEVTGGSAIAGDDSIGAVLREIKEEVGLDLEEDQGQCIFTRRFDSNHPYFLDIWFFEHQIVLKKLKLQKEEVSDARLATKEAIIKMMDEGTFVPNDSIKYCLEELDNLT